MMKIKHSFFAALIYFLFFSLTYAYPVDKLVMFGDSLSDNGNIYNLSVKAHKVIPMIPVIPKESAYFKGRFSNGPVWIEDLADAIDVPLEDYAYGGSWAEPFKDSGLIIPFGLGDQVNMYLVAAATDYDIGKHLFFIWTGGNDYITPRDDVDYATSSTVSSIKKNIEWLVWYGARHVVVMSIPDVSQTPKVIMNGAEAVENARQLVESHNAKLKKMVEELKAEYPVSQYPGIDFIYADMTTPMQDAIIHPDQYGLKNTSNPCYDGSIYFGNPIDEKEIAAAKQANIDIMKSPALKLAYINGRTASILKNQFCAEPDDYLFWDALHPTKKVHGFMATMVWSILSDKIEPITQTKL